MSADASVIIPVYNVETALSECVDSVLKQSYDNIEIILVNDGSTDTSGRICDEYAQKDHRITVIHKANKGLSDARNCGMEKATAPILFFVDSDDRVAPNFISACMKAFRENPDADIVHFGYREFSGAGVLGVERKFLPEKDCISGKEATSHCLQNSGDIVVWNKAYRRELFQNNRFSVGIIHEDEDITYRLLYEAKTVVYLQETLYYYRIRQNSIMRKAFSAKNLVLLSIMEDRIAYFQRQAAPELQSLSESQYYHVLRTYYAIMMREKAKFRQEISHVMAVIQKNRSLFLANPHIGSFHKIILKVSGAFPVAFHVYIIKDRMTNKR